MAKLNAYHRLLKSHFLAVQSAQTAVLMGLGDVSAQQIVERKGRKNHDLGRTLNFVFLGAALVGPAVTQWYKFLSRTFGSEKNPMTTLKKVACDQLIFAPGFLVIFLTSLNVIRGKNMEHLKHDFKTKYKDIILTNWKVWPMVQAGNFYFVPLKYQVLLVQSVALVWNTYLAWKTSLE